LARLLAHLGVERFRVAATQFGHIANPEQKQVRGNRRPDAGNARQVEKGGQPELRSFLKAPARFAVER
jgi:hypothetical protein